jgi:hypothetical protein
MDSALDDVTWNAATGYQMTPRINVWASVRQEARDPLYWNPSRRIWNVGLTTRLGRSGVLRHTIPTASPGRLEIRVPVSDAPTSRLWIAGSFNEWQPTPMRREGDSWVIQIRLAAGVYQFAFRTDSGTWFVPPSLPGRRSDGFGGHVAVLVVG